MSKKFLFVILLCVIIFAIIDGKTFAKWCSACNKTLPNIVTSGDSCQFVKSFNINGVKVWVTYIGTYNNTVSFKQCGSASIFSTCTDKSISKVSTCIGTAVNRPPGVPRNWSIEFEFTKNDVCE
jgi:hypothetical protein